MEHIQYFTKKLHSFSGKIVYMNLLGMVLVSFLDGIGVVLLIPMLNMSSIISISPGAPAISGIFNILQGLPKTLGLLLILSVYILLIVSQSLIKRNLSLRDIKIHTGFVNHVRLEIYRTLLQANWDFFIKKRRSDLIHALTDELGRVTSGTKLFLQFLSSLVFTLIQIGIAFWLSPKLTVFVLCCGLISVYLSRNFVKKAKKLGNQTTMLAKSYLAGISDHFNGIKDIKSNMLEESRYRWLHDWCHKIAYERYEHTRLTTNSQLIYRVSSAFIIAFFIFFSVVVFNTPGGQLLIIIVIFSRLWPQFTGIQSNLEQIAAAAPAFKTLMELQKECEKAKEVKDDDHYTNVKPLSIKRGIECRSVNFRYNPSGTIYALQDISVEILSKSMTAIVGPSGAGKSTLIDILMGLMQAERGQVLIDGVPLTSDNVLSFRRSISYVPQDPFLFNATVKENLLLIDPSASDDQIWEALEFAAAAEFVKRLPKRLDTLIGDRGIRLSGGERQRLVLARAILRKPSILVLDEATSALDSENEAKIQQALERISGTMMIIVIAHRLSTIRNADQVIVLDQGRILQKGGFNQLAGDKGGLFSVLLGNQVRDATVIA